MKNFYAAFSSEIIKLKRLSIVWITAIIFVFIPLMMTLLMYIAQHPEVAAKVGIIGTKASLFTENNWAGYLMVLNQIIASVGLIGFGFITAWVFGSEYLNHTITNLLVLPLSRSSIVYAKMLVVTFWCMALGILMYGSGILAGHLINIPGWSVNLLKGQTLIYFKITILTLFLSTPVALISGIGRGIIAPIGFSILFMIVAQFAALMGLGPYFPWAIPGLLCVPEGTEGMQLVKSSYFILMLTSFAGLAGTVYWWRKADQH